MTDTEFKAWPKTPRLFRDVVITEKIDGTNAAVIITPTSGTAGYETADGFLKIEVDGDLYFVGAQSRNRLLKPTKEADNYGFARWVRDNAEALVRALGPGRHFGEWYGQGIQRRYGLTEKRFAIFNPYAEIAVSVPGLGVVPKLYEGPFDTATVDNVMTGLRNSGSYAAEGFMNPEGIIVYHSAAQHGFKVTFEHDNMPKGAVSK